MIQRPRRNRKSAAIRALVQETRLHPNQLVQPLFLVDGKNKNNAIKSLPTISQLSIDNALKEIEICMKLGVNSFILFPAVEDSLKDKKATYRDVYKRQLLINPDNKEMPDLFGFICEDEELGKYYGPKIFKGTPFENAPVLVAKITMNIDFPNSISTKIEVAGHVIELELSNFDEAQFYHREGGMPFTQNVVEAVSYTHLDVYKRQVVTFFAIQSFL